MPCLISTLRRPTGSEARSIHVRPHEPELLTVGDFILDAVLRRVEETEREYNQGLAVAASQCGPCGSGSAAGSHSLWPAPSCRRGCGASGPRPASVRGRGRAVWPFRSLSAPPTPAGGRRDEPARR